MLDVTENRISTSDCEGDVLHALGIPDTETSPTPHSVARNRTAISIQPMFLFSLLGSGQSQHDARHCTSHAARGFTCGMAATACLPSCRRTDGLTLAAECTWAMPSHLQWVSLSPSLFLFPNSSIFNQPCLPSLVCAALPQRNPPLDAVAHIAVRGMILISTGIHVSWV